MRVLGRYLTLENGGVKNASSRKPSPREDVDTGHEFGAGDGAKMLPDSEDRTRDPWVTEAVDRQGSHADDGDDLTHNSQKVTEPPLAGQ